MNVATIINMPSRRDLIVSAAASTAVATLPAVALTAPSGSPLLGAIAEHHAAYAAYNVPLGRDPSEEEENAFLAKIEELETAIIEAEPVSETEMVALIGFTQKIAGELHYPELTASTLDKAMRFISGREA
jgi:hypothetical protein